MLIARISGIQIFLNNWFIILFILFTVAGIGGKAFLVFSAVLWHELAHAAVALYLGLKVKEVELLPFGGVARIEGLYCAGTMREIVIAAAGPFASLGLAAVIYIKIVHSGYQEVWEFFFRTNLMLAAFNLIPALPLDGGRIARAWLSYFMDYGKATTVTARLSKLISILLIGFTIYEFQTSSTMNITFIIAAVFLYVTASQEIKIAGFRSMAVLSNKKARLLQQGLLPTIHITVVNSTPIREIIRLLMPDQYYMVIIVDEKCKICGTITETNLWEGVQEKGIYIPIREFL